MNHKITAGKFCRLQNYFTLAFCSNQEILSDQASGQPNFINIFIATMHNNQLSI